MASSYIIVVMAARTLDDTQYLLMWDFHLNPPSDLECQVALLQDKDVEKALEGIPDLVEPPPKEEVAQYPDSELVIPCPPEVPSQDQAHSDSDESQDSEVHPLDRAIDELEFSSDSDCSFEDLEGDYLNQRDYELLRIKFEVARLLNDMVSTLCG